jgi:hypothetical protein
LPDGQYLLWLLLLLSPAAAAAAAAAAAYPAAAASGLTAAAAAASTLAHWLPKQSQNPLALQQARFSPMFSAKSAIAAAITYPDTQRNFCTSLCQLLCNGPAEALQA